MAFRMNAIPEEYTGPEGEPILATYVGMQAGNKPGLIILHFVCEHGPLPLYVHGEVITGEGDTQVVLRSRKLQEIEWSESDIGDDFIVTVSRHKKSDGTFGKPCIVEIDRMADTEIEDPPTQEEINQTLSLFAHDKGDGPEDTISTGDLSPVSPLTDPASDAGSEAGQGDAIPLPVNGEPKQAPEAPTIAKPGKTKPSYRKA